MYIVTVVPVTKTGVPLEYFSSTHYKVGSCLIIPLRKKEVRAVVTNVKTVRAQKSSLRGASFTVRKLQKQTPLYILPSLFITACMKSSLEHATKPGALYSQYLLKEYADTEIPYKPKKQIAFEQPLHHTIYQGKEDERKALYRTLVREQFAQQKSVYIIVPQAPEAERIYTHVKHGITDKTILLHNTLSPKQKRTALRQAVTQKGPLLVVLTPSFVGLPRYDIGACIIDREGSEAYRQVAHPHSDTRILIEHYASLLGATYISADLPLSIHTHYKKRQELAHEVTSGNQRPQLRIPYTIIDRSIEKKDPLHKKPFSVLAPESWNTLEEMCTKGKRSLLLVGRRGRAPTTVCSDCGKLVSCEHCESAMILHASTTGTNYFLCHSCSHERSANERCKYCTSWKLKALGVGIERVTEELSTRVDDAMVHTISSDTTTTPKQVRDTLARAQDMPGSVTIATSMVLPYLEEESIPFVCIVSLDTLLTLSAWNSHEHVARLLTRTHDIAGEAHYIQTRNSTHSVLTSIGRGNSSKFYKEELRMRKQYGYPPYTVLVRIDVFGKKQEVTEMLGSLTEQFGVYGFSPFPRLRKKEGGKYGAHGFMRFTREEWPNEDVVTQLQALPPYIRVTVNPQSVL